MVNYTNEYLFRKDSINKSWLIFGDGISLSNADLYSESVELQESICPDDNIVFGNCPASVFKFTTSAISTSFIGKEISVSIVLNNDSVNPFYLGTYIVTEETLSADRTQKNIVAHDAIHNIINANVASWYNALTFPMTLKNFRDSLFVYMGIAQETATLINDSMVVEKTIDADTISGADVIKAICEINGCFGHINRDGSFKYIILDNTSAYNITSSMYSSCEYADYEVQTIDKLQIREESGDIGVVVGTGTNAYIIEDNFLVYGKSSSDLLTIATNILSVIDNISFVPCRISCIGNPCVEVGDYVTLTKANGDDFNTYVLNRTIKGIQFLFDDITADGDETYPENVNGVNLDIIQLRGKSNVLERSIEETRSSITDVAAGLQTEITQTAQGLQIQITDLQEQIDGETAYYERESGAPTLLNYPYWDFTSAFKCDGTKKCDALYTTEMAEGGDQYPHFYYSEQDRKDHRSDLCYVDSDNLAYRFVLENGVWYWKEIADSDYTQILSRLATLEATAEELSVEYTEISATVSSQGLVINNHTSQLSQTATQISSLVSTTTSQGNRLTTAESKITQNSNSITAEVNRASTAEGNLSSRITQTANSITSEVTRATNAEGTLSSRISQNTTSINAKVSQTGGNNQSFGWSLTSGAFDLYSGNTRVFRCNSNGISINGSGTFSGTVTASSGAIGGWSISGGAIQKIDSSHGTKVVLQNDGTIVCYRTSDNYPMWALQCDGGAQFHGNVTVDGYATAATVSAVDAKFSNLNASNITSGTLSADRIAGGSITAGKIAGHSLTVDKLYINNQNVFSLGGAVLGCGGIACDGGVNINFSGRMYTLYRDGTTGAIYAR